MQVLDPLVFWAVFQEMLGPFLLWTLIFLVSTITIAFFWLLIRERCIVSKRLVISEFIGIIGGVLALALMVKITSSSFTDAGGPTDWFLISLVFGLGFFGTSILVYSIAGWRSILRART
ncbi:MAG: DUF5368 domain-containing protein [Azovibrio sp.]